MAQRSGDNPDRAATQGGRLAERSEDSVTTITIGGQQAATGLAVIAFVALAAAITFGWMPSPSMPEPEGSTSLWIIFLTGLSVGGLSCLAVQGGLLAAMIATRQTADDDGKPSTWKRSRPVVQFLGAKVAAYALLGAVLGYFGSKIPLSTQGWLLIAAGVFMFVVVLQMLDVHPAFRRISFTPPKSVQRRIRAQSKRADAVGPFVLGALTIFIPCGVTLAMEAVAIASESPARGALVMTAFTLGTAPIFLLLGVAATELSGSAKKVFRPLAMAMITIIAGMSMISGMRLVGWTGGVGGDAQAAQVVQSAPAEGIAGPDASAGAYQEATIDVITGAFVPSIVQVKAGLPTRLNLVTDRTRGCIRAFVIPALGIERYLPETGTETVEIPPSEPGRIAFMCSMGMYNGVIEVVE